MGADQSAPGYRADYRAHPPAPARQETEAERQERLARAAMFEDKTKRWQKKDQDLVKQENWRKYADIDKEKKEREGILNTVTATAAAPTATAAARRVTGGSGTVGVPTTSSSSGSLPPASCSSPPLPYDPDAARAARGAAMQAKTSKIKSYKSQPKPDHWESYKQLEQVKQRQQAAIPISIPSPTSSNPADNFAAQFASDLSLTTPATADGPNRTQSPPSSASSSSPPPSNADDSAFYQQMFYLIGKAQRMPSSSIGLLTKILSNLLQADSVPDGYKYRRLKLENDRIQRDIVSVDGAIEILIAAGFDRQVQKSTEGKEEQVLFCPVDTPLNIAQLALEKLIDIQSMS